VKFNEKECHWCGAKFNETDKRGTPNLDDGRWYHPECMQLALSVASRFNEMRNMSVILWQESLNEVRSRSKRMQRRLTPLELIPSA